MTAARFGKSLRGADMLLFNGFSYVKDRSFNETINWRCSLFRKLQCRARAITKRIDGVEMVKASFNVHSHQHSNITKTNLEFLDAQRFGRKK